jgi:hypothetical protein
MISEENLALKLNKLDFPFNQGYFVQSLIEIDLLVLEKIFKNFQCIFTLLPLSPLGKEDCPSYEQF